MMFWLETGYKATPSNNNQNKDIDMRNSAVVSHAAQAVWQLTDQGRVGALLLPNFLAAAPAPDLPLSQAALLLLPSTAMTHQKAKNNARFLLWFIFAFCQFSGHFSELNQLTERPSKYQGEHWENTWHGGGAGVGAPSPQVDTEVNREGPTDSNRHSTGPTFGGRGQIPMWSPSLLYMC